MLLKRRAWLLSVKDFREDELGVFELAVGTLACTSFFLLQKLQVSLSQIQSLEYTEGGFSESTIVNNP